MDSNDSIIPRNQCNAEEFAFWAFSFERLFAFASALALVITAILLYPTQTRDFFSRNHRNNVASSDTAFAPSRDEETEAPGFVADVDVATPGSGDQGLESRNPGTDVLKDGKH